MNNKYDLIIIGAGPAGLSAGLYAARGGLSALIIEKSAVGGQITTTTEIENYPGAPENSTGTSLTERMKEQAVSFGAEIINKEVKNIKRKDGSFILNTSEEEYKSRACIIAAGANPKMLGVKGESKFRGMGVSYCATCDGGFFKNLEVLVVGGGDSALQEALYLTKFAKKVTVIHRRDKFRASVSLQNKIFEHDKIDIIFNGEVREIYGKDFVEGAKLYDNVQCREYDFKTDGVFIFVGNKPNSDIFKDIVKLDEGGYIKTDNSFMTCTEALFAAGDVRSGALRQVITAAAEGANAAVEAEKLIGKL